MKNIGIFLIILMLGLVITGCKKDNSDSDILVTKATGTYTGKATFNKKTYAATAEITKESGTSVSIYLALYTQKPKTMAGISVSDGGGGTVSLTGLDGQVTGKVSGKVLTLNYFAVYFYGSKP